jgi:hypothetical protein
MKSATGGMPGMPGMPGMSPSAAPDKSAMPGMKMPSKGEARKQ